ncbi:MAG: glycerol-3-phosphate 1-O-acyltransferase PlsY [Clostridia bacterium]|nr:glycerol-3-phosphate 1-O-acyltransferase PlsY [Clostridia bacterium]
MVGYIFTALGVLVVAYLIGSVSFAVIFSKIFTGKDVRDEGSGNAGATNTLRTVGVLPGILTFVFDALKGFAACIIGKTVFSYLYTTSANEIFTPAYGAYLCCVVVMLGHIFPLFFGFKGGKAVACSVGTFAVCCPIAIILGLIGFAVSLLVCKIVSLSSLVATIIVVGASVTYQFFAEQVNYNIIPVIVLSIVAGAIVFIKHKDNIIRLARGTEQKITSKK